MSRLRLSAIQRLLCVVLSVSIPAAAQLGQRGTVSGQVYTVDHSLVAGATVSLLGADGFKRVQSSGTQGDFSLIDLPSGTYTVQVSAIGLAPAAQSGVSVAVGRNTLLTFTLQVAGTTQQVNVSTEQSSLDASQTSPVVNIDRDRVEELPIPSRNYLSFVLLSPQVTPANPVFSQQSLAQSGGGFGFGGLRPSSNSVRLDGVSDDDEFTGSSRTQLSPEAISDFQIVNHGFAAESGGGAGGSIEVQTREGLNRVHGDAFIFEQNGTLNGTPPLGIYPYKPDENRFRAGIALGGAMQRDRMFYYAAAEQEIAHGEDVNDLKPAVVTQINATLQQPGPAQGLILKTGLFPTTEQETELSGRLDRIFTEHQSAMLRYAFTNSRHGSDAFNTDELSDVSARGSAFTADNSLNGTLTSAVSKSFLNKASFEVSQRRSVERTGTTAFPGVLIPGVALFGTPYAGNSRRFETHIEFEETVILQLRKHLLQFGAGLDRTSLRSAITDGSRGLFVFSSLNAFSAAAPDFFIQSFYSNADVNFAEYRSKAYVQDHWTPTQTVAVDFGARYEDNYLPASLPKHPLNLSPRVGIAWTPRRSLVIRSGFGIFEDRFLLSTINRLVELDGHTGFTQIVEDTAATTAYRASGATLVPMPSVEPSIWRATQSLQNPYSEVASLGVEYALPLQTTLKAEYQFVNGVHLGRTTNTNLATPVILTAQNAAGLGVRFPTAQQLGNLVFSPARLNPAYDAINQFATSAHSNYNGATLTLNRQFTDDFQLLVGYTFSKTLDDASMDTEQPQNPYNLRAEYGPSLQDQRHRLTLSGLWLIGPDLNDPQDAAANENPSRFISIVTGLEFAPILSLSTGFRPDPVVGLDSNREHIYPFADRPTGYGRNSLLGSGIIDFNVRVLKMIPLGKGHLDLVAESFNLLNHENVGILNTAFGSGLSAQAGFGRPISTSTARRIQFSLDYEF